MIISSQHKAKTSRAIYFHCSLYIALIAKKKKKKKVKKTEQMKAPSPQHAERSDKHFKFIGCFTRMLPHLNTMSKYHLLVLGRWRRSICRAFIPPPSPKKKTAFSFRTSMVKAQITTSNTIKSFCWTQTSLERISSTTAEDQDGLVLWGGRLLRGNKD